MSISSAKLIHWFLFLYLQEPCLLRIYSQKIFCRFPTLQRCFRCKVQNISFVNPISFKKSFHLLISSFHCSNDLPSFSFKTCSILKALWSVFLQFFVIKSVLTTFSFKSLKVMFTILGSWQCLSSNQYYFMKFPKHLSHKVTLFLFLATPFTLLVFTAHI